ncbi:hypothetical protein PHYC_03394 [Phycisphaerales bacterium]|nr:hypothetical protein PHYC_03394 [Phycisphaerales bacterium]
MIGQTATHTTLLTRLADAGDAMAWRDFLARYGDLIRGFCQRRGLQAADCEDVQQEVLLSLTKSMGQFRYDPAKGLFRSYLKTVVMNAISRRLCQNPAHAGLSQASAVGDSAGEEHWEQEWRQHHFRQAMRVIESEFSESDRRAFAMYAVEGRGVPETARELGISPDAVYQAKSRVLRRLGQLIEGQVAEEG